MTETTETTETTDDVITGEDLEWLNRRMVGRAADAVRAAGTVLMAVGVVGVAASVWLVWRIQQRLGDSTFDSFGEGDDASWVDRFDGLANAYGTVVLPVIAVALGYGLRLVADYAVVRTGGQLGEFTAGDRVPPGPPGAPGAPGEGEPEPTLPPDPAGYEPRA
jgi:hypothetical protein